jgi:hypothetical protein
MAVYPNPASEFWNIAFTNKPNGTIVYTLKDISGKTVSHNNITLGRSGTFQIANKNLTAGIYLLSVIANGMVFNQKVIKQ